MKQEELESIDNVSTVIQFVLLGFSYLPVLQEFLFAVFFVVYIIILIGNFLIILVTSMDSALQKPMYFFLSGNLLCISDCPKDSVQHWDTEPKHFTDVLCYTTVLLPCFWNY